MIAIQNGARAAGCCSQ